LVEASGTRKRFREDALLLRKIANNCSHARVAEAAVASLGPEFLRFVTFKSAAAQMTVGDYVGWRVRRFARQAPARSLLDLKAATAKADTPVLAGIRHIIEAELFEDADFEPEEDLIAPYQASALAQRPAA
jgi:hypothetical protein